MPIYLIGIYILICNILQINKEKLIVQIKSDLKKFVAKFCSFMNKYCSFMNDNSYGIIINFQQYCVMLKFMR